MSNDTPSAEATFTATPFRALPRPAPEEIPGPQEPYTGVGMSTPRAIYTRAAPFVWGAGLCLLAVAASTFPVAAVAWYGIATFALLALGALGRGVRGLLTDDDRAVQPPASRLGHRLAAASVPAVGGWFAAMAGYAPCPAALQWTGGALFGTVALCGLVLGLLAPEAISRPLFAHLHDPFGLVLRAE